MRFPRQNQLALPCVLEGLVPGQPHPDGRRYLPLLIFRLTGAAAPAGLRLGVVDRHHRVDEALVGRAGSARLVCALGALRLQGPSPHRGVTPEANWAPPRASTAPTLYGQVREILAWEPAAEPLPFASLYTELLLDIGYGVVGVRTSISAGELAEASGPPRLQPGDYIALSRARIDILAFEAG